MAPSREIEKLQRRWQENPLGLTFAPLAEAYRKEGMYADALDLLSIGLSQHPNYVPAHIVRGRCHLDTHTDNLAEEAFLKVTELDPENVIALKGLADLSERGGRPEQAIARLERLLDFDRSNEDAREQLERLQSSLSLHATIVETPMPSPPPPPVVPHAVDEPFAETIVPSFVPQSPPVDAPVAEAASPIATSAAPPSGAEPAAATEPEPPQAEVVDALQQDVEVILYQPLELSATAETEFQVPDAADTLRPSAAHGAIDYQPDTPLVEHHAEAAAAAPQPTSEITAEPAPAEPAPEPIAPPTPVVDEPFVVDASAVAEPAPAEPIHDVVPPPAPAPEPPIATAEPAVVNEAPISEVEDAVDFSEEETVIEAVSDPGTDDVDAVAGVEAEPELVVTETMAELFLRQGHRELALAVYSQLATREPENSRIRDAIAGLQAELKPAAAPSIPAFAAVLTGGQSVRGLFEQLLSTTRPAPPGRPEAAAGLSLGAVFGEDQTAAATAPGTPEVGPSYDEFYADERTPSGVPAEPGPPEPDEANPEDLESFTSWLKGLKR